MKNHTNLAAVLSLPIDFESLDLIEQMKIAINAPENVKATAKYIVAAMDVRSNINKDYWNFTDDYVWFALNTCNKAFTIKSDNCVV